MVFPTETAFKRKKYADSPVTPVRERGGTLVGEIVAVGTELLLGQILNSNARYLSEVLARLGIDVYHQSVVGDNRARAAAVLRQALGRSDLVVTSGGLGPTEDDLTREAVADALGLGLEENPEARAVVESYFERRGRAAPAANRRQWTLPAGARALPNPNGSAPGFVVEKDGRLVVCLPGPPGELQPMVEAHVIPLLAAHPGRGGRVILSRVLHLGGIGEAAAERRVAHLLAGTNPTVAPYAHPGQVDLRLTAKAATESEARALLAPVEAEIRARLGRHVFGADDETLESVVGDLLRRRGLTLALAESCTGGLVAGRITRIAGSSDYFLLGAVTYANAAKERILGVPSETLRRHGAVSRETALAMAEGARRAAGASVAVSITGIAGPAGGTPEKPVGTVYFGLAAAEGRWWRRGAFLGDRETIRRWSAQEALYFLRSYLLDPRAPEGEPDAS